METVFSVLKQQSVDCKSALELGCGPGTTARFWPENKFLNGVDFDNDAISWCASNLKPSIFKQIHLHQPIPFASESFDLVFSPYLFTILNEDDQNFYLTEIARVLRPNGVAILFFRSQAEILRNLKDDEYKRFCDGSLVVINQLLSGRIACKACHTENYIRRTFSRVMPIVDFQSAKLCQENGVSVTLRPFIVLRKIG